MRTQIGYLVASLNRQLEQELEDKLRSENLPVEHLRVLEVLSSLSPSSGGLPMTELANRVLVNGPTLTKIIDKMINESYVHRTTDLKDRRRVLIMLSPGGRALRKRIHAHVQDQERRLQTALPTNDLNALRSLLSTLTQK